MEILNNIDLSCKGIAGVKTLYVFSYVKYPRSQIGVNDNILTSFPSTDIYEFQTVGGVSFDESITEDDGGKYYDINLSFKTHKLINPLSIVNKDIRAIVLDNNGNYRLLGNYNGLTNESFKKTTGQGKSDFNGYEFTFKGKELRESFFINDLNILTQFYYLQQENDYYLLQENGYKIRL